MPVRADHLPPLVIACVYRDADWSLVIALVSLAIARWRAALFPQRRVGEQGVKFRIFVAKAPGSPAILECHFAVVAMRFKIAALRCRECGPATGQWRPPHTYECPVRHEVLAGSESNHLQAA
ncbi:hypothetical protein CAK95_17860 [Pseudorhodoplanes sinuspersici]|uniref:Uncharacterized protein n=2 Tax=Pseudorhodoplanes sinuspersici TaxID=1235591 RepID=A0A1W6ZTU8_9HYPH|nr:hypothetical protein CAK95_17860 [Pseudorhodoplanes sinuspersici]